MTRRPNLWPLLGAIALLVLVVPTARPDETPAAEPAAVASPALAAEFVGSETCTACHDTLEATLAGTPHGSSGFTERAVHGCETCHGPGGAHADDPDNVALRPRVDKLDAAAQAAVCQQCHTGGQQFFWDGSTHESKNISCIDCHTVHAGEPRTAQLKAQSTSEQCMTCHKSVRAETWKTSHHPVREGKMSCVDCHNPHGSPTEKMLAAGSVNELCWTCHTEKRGPFLWEHPPVRENCLNCHSPHGSNHLKLQRTSVPFICQQCHANTRHPGSLYDANGLATGARASNREFNRACVDCHAAIHGSNHPSSPYLAH